MLSQIWVNESKLISEGGLLAIATANLFAAKGGNR